MLNIVENVLQHYITLYNDNMEPTLEEDKSSAYLYIETIDARQN